jgi:hypothetical protein
VEIWEIVIAKGVVEYDGVEEVQMFRSKQRAASQKKKTNLVHKR